MALPEWEVTDTYRTLSRNAHNRTFDEQINVYQKYINDRALTGVFPEAVESIYVTNVVEAVFEETMQLTRAIGAPTGYEDTYEYIFSKKRRFPSKYPPYVKTRVYPIVYMPIPGDIVTLPIHLMAEVAKEDPRVMSPTNWEMEVEDVFISKTQSYTWKASEPNKLSNLMSSKIQLNAVTLQVRPIGGNGLTFSFPEISMNHFVLLKPFIGYEGEA